MIYNPYKEILNQLDAALMEHQLRQMQIGVSPYEYDDDSFISCVNIFLSGLMWKLWEKQNQLNLDANTRMKEGRKIGEELRDFIFMWTGFDTMEYRRNENCTKE